MADTGADPDGASKAEHLDLNTDTALHGTKLLAGTVADGVSEAEHLDLNTDTALYVAKFLVGRHVGTLEMVCKSWRATFGTFNVWRQILDQEKLVLRTRPDLHPYQRVHYGTEEEIARMDLPQIKMFYRQQKFHQKFYAGVGSPGAVGFSMQPNLYIFRAPTN